MSENDHLIDAATAARRLGVTRATLYAYVSRGMVHAVELPGDPRKRLYNSHDIERLMKRKSVGRRPKSIAENTLDWGMPVLRSAITLIADDALSYRGRDAVEWSQTATLEDTARLLWQCGAADPFAGKDAEPEQWNDAIFAEALRLPLPERCAVLVSFTGAGRLAMWQRDQRRLWPGAATLVRSLTAAASASRPTTLPAHRHLQEVWKLDERGAEAVRRALVLLADHELNASAFAVRVVASTGASLGAAVNAGLAALSGPMHGGMTSLVELLFDELSDGGDVRQLIEKRLRRGDGVPGFDHPLYPAGDPRARALLTLLPAQDSYGDISGRMEEMTGRYPNIDFALVSLRRHFGLPEGAALSLFAIGRVVGWIAHALEQGGEGRLIRPRADYTGPLPGR